MPRYYVRMTEMGSPNGATLVSKEVGEADAFTDAKALLIAELREEAGFRDDGELYTMAAADVAKATQPGYIEVGVGAELDAPTDRDELDRWQAECENGRCGAPGYTSWEITTAAPHAVGGWAGEGPAVERRFDYEAVDAEQAEVT